MQSSKLVAGALFISVNGAILRDCMQQDVNLRATRRAPVRRSSCHRMQIDLSGAQRSMKRVHRRRRKQDSNREYYAVHR